jgi:hypothetical protein
MRAHWSDCYREAKHTPETDCFYWFRRVQKEQFGRYVRDVTDEERRSRLAVARLMAGNVLELFGWQSTNCPADGDAVCMTEANRAHHIGVAFFIRGKLHVLHVAENANAMVSDRLHLAANGWKITGFYTPA